MFYSVAIFGMLALLLMIPIQETQPRKIDFKLTDIIPRPSELIAPEVFVPAGIMLLITVCTGLYMLLIPDISTHLGIENKGLFFFTHMLSSLVVRFLAGRISDRIGRRKTLLAGVIIFTIATIIMVDVIGVYMFLFCGFVYGVGTGIISPTLMAWTTDLSNPKFKGRGLSTMWMGLEFGVMIGALCGDFLYQNNPENLPFIFLIATVILVAIVLYLLTLGRKVPVSFVEK